MDAGREADRKLGSWAGREALLSSALDAVQALNERTLMCLVRLAEERLPNPPRLVGAVAAELRDLDPGACSTIARQPFLFVDFAFGNPRTLLPLLTRDGRALRFPSPRGTFAAGEATALARGALVLAQAVCRHHPAHAGLLLGLHPLLQQPLAALRGAFLPTPRLSCPSQTGCAQVHFGTLGLHYSVEAWLGATAWDRNLDLWAGAIVHIDPIDFRQKKSSRSIRSPCATALFG